jgi:hypothetical protein
MQCDIFRTTNLTVKPRPLDPAFEIAARKQLAPRNGRLQVGRFTHPPPSPLIVSR